jgi:membrane protease YdiL (CAAX protease family)
MSGAVRSASSPEGSPAGVMVCIVTFYLAVILAGCGLIALHRGAEAIPALVLGPGAGWSALAGTLVAAGALLTTHAGFHRVHWMRRLARVVRRFFGPLSAGQAAGLGLLTGVAEEVLFRGGLQPLLGLTVTSLLFGFLHVLPPLRRNWPWTAFAIAMGFLLGAITEATGNLTGAVVAHVAVNTVNLGRIGRL